MGRARVLAWGRVLALVLCGVAPWLLARLDVFGDRGLNHVLTGMLWAGVALFLGLSFFLSGARSRRTRARVGLALLLLAGLAALLLRYEGLSGDLVPRLSWRLGSARVPPAQAGAEPAPGSARVDLGRATPLDSPGFLGPNRDGRFPEVLLARDWQAQPPRCLWRAPIGPGWSGFAVVNGWALTMELGPSGERTSARDARSGELAWVHDTGDVFREALGGDGPRATPFVSTLDGGRVYALGALGRLSCLEGASGRLLWERDLLAELGLTPEQDRMHVAWGRAGSPLLADGRLFVAAGGAPGGKQIGLLALDPRSGATLWEGPPRQVSYSSPSACVLAGREQILIVNEASVSGHDPLDGALLWEHPWPGSSSAGANVSQALPIAPDRVLLSKGYGGGGLLLALETGPQGLSARELWHHPRWLRTKLTSAIERDGWLYALDEGVLECVELERGELRWREGRYGHGQLLATRELLLVLGEEGELSVLAAGPEGPGEALARFQVLEGKCWAPPTLYGGLLLARSDEQCAAWELPLAPR